MRNDWEVKMKDKIKTFHCGVDVTYNTWVWVEASSESEAEELAVNAVEENCPDNFAGADVHTIHEEN